MSWIIGIDFVIGLFFSCVSRYSGKLSSVCYPVKSNHAIHENNHSIHKYKDSANRKIRECRIWCYGIIVL